MNAGRVTRNCKPEERSLESFAKGAPEICAIVGGKGFEEMAKGYFNSQRFLEGAGRGVLDTCSPSRFCREDYICARTPSGQGACIPPYFLFQMRVDGHP